MAPNQAAGLINEIKDIVGILQQDAVTEDVKPLGLTDEQFENVCKTCERFKHKCTDAVAVKYPGKCDPILKYIQSQKQGG
ncbi:MAG: hypothetical protein Q7R33_06080 [Nitrosarchaeum sp.]|nr:hypothetical protein [Nitrosarchaeum sp.]